MQKHHPKVSVIIATFNRGDMIVESLESVMNQTYTDFEVIVVDDGSTDNTEEALKPYFDRITYIRQDNAGAAAARNRGGEVAKGEYIAFQDSDDIWLPDKLKKQIAFFERNPQYTMATCNGIIFGIPEEAGRLAIAQKRAKRLEKEGVTLRSTFMKSSIRCVAMILKRSVFEEVGGFDTDMRSSIDLELAFRVLTKYKIGFQNDAMIKIRMHSDNLGKDRERGQLENIKAIRKLLEGFPEAERIIGPKNVRKRLAYRYYRLGKIYLKRRDPRRAAEYLRKTDQYMPLSAKYLFYRFIADYRSASRDATKQTGEKDYLEVRKNGFVFRLRAGCVRPPFLKWLMEEANSSDTAYDSTSRHARNRKARVELGDGVWTLYVKRFFSPNIGYSLKDFFRASKAVKAWKAGLMLEGYGFHCASSVVVGEKRRWGRLVDSLLVATEVKAPSIIEFLEKWADASRDTDAIRRDTDAIRRDTDAIRTKRRLIGALGGEVGRMHLLGILHGDLLPGNILVDESEGKARFVFLDNDRTAKFIRNLPDKLVVRNLVQLGRFVLPGVTLTDRLRFFKAYIEQNPRFKDREKDLLRRIVRKTRRRVIKIGEIEPAAADSVSFRDLMSGKI